MRALFSPEILQDGVVKGGGGGGRGGERKAKTAAIPCTPPHFLGPETFKDRHDGSTLVPRHEVPQISTLQIPSFGQRRQPEQRPVEHKASTVN